MPDLTQSLEGSDLGHLRIIAELWGIELNAPDARVGMQRLPPLLLSPAAVQEMLENLPAEARAALDALLLSDGRMPWPTFIRRFGELREMGAGRRDRERPYLKPASAAEMLFYRALVARAFFDEPSSSSGLEEYAYIPEDLLALLPAPQGQGPAPLGRRATPAERRYPFPVDDSILDHACTLLAALRMGLTEDEINAAAHSWGESFQPLAPTALRGLLSAAGLLEEGDMPRPEPVRIFLEASRGEALSTLVRAWLESPDFNELRLLPGLQCEGEWRNDPLQTRRAVLGFLDRVPDDQWWNLPAFLSAIRQRRPDFQRPSGDYDSWFIRQQSSGEYLRGFACWDDVDGALINYLLTGPMHWLGIIDLASPAPDALPLAFKRSTWASALLKGEILNSLPAEDKKFSASSDARLRAPRLTPRAARYQLARFTQWEGDKEGIYSYRLTPASLERARQQGLGITHLLSLLRRSTQTLPPSLVKALERWEAHGVEARFERVLVLRLATPEMLQALRSSRAARYLGDPLGPTAVVIKGDALEKVMVVLSEMGYLGALSADLGTDAAVYSRNG